MHLNNNDPRIVVQSEPYLDLRKTIDLTELGILHLLVSQMEPDDENNKLYQINLNDLSAYSGASSTWHDLQRIALGLNQKLTNQDQAGNINGSVSFVNSIMSVGFEPSLNCLEIAINPLAKPVFLNLKQALSSI